MINMSNQLSHNQEYIIIRADSLAALMSNLDSEIKQIIDSNQCIKTLQGHTDLVHSVSFSADGYILASN